MWFKNERTVSVTHYDDDGNLWQTALAQVIAVFPPIPPAGAFTPCQTTTAVDAAIITIASDTAHNLLLHPILPELLPMWLADNYAKYSTGAPWLVCGIFAHPKGVAIPGCLIYEEFVQLATVCGFTLLGHADQSLELLSSLSQKLEAIYANNACGLCKPINDHDSNTHRAIGTMRAALLSNSLSCQFLLLCREVPRWRVLPATIDHYVAFAELFQTCFGSTISREHWQWKYHTYNSYGILVLEGARIIAHYGIMMRQVLIHGVTAMALQPVDVMVTPRSRGILTRSGPMRQAATAVLAANLGAGKRCAIGFGFPNYRALQLGEKLGLYAACGPMEEWWWPIKQQYELVDWWLHKRILTTAAQVNTWANICWSQMRMDLTDAVCGVRDGAWLNYRYLQHPAKNYTILGVANRLTGRRLGIVVLRIEAKNCEIVDLIGRLVHIPYLLHSARRHAINTNCERMFVWISHRYGTIFAKTGATKDNSLNLHNTMAARYATISPARLYDQWWLTGGDSDFR